MRTCKAFIFEELFGVFAGKGGQTVQGIEKRSGAKVQVCKNVLNLIVVWEYRSIAIDKITLLIENLWLVTNEVVPTHGRSIVNLVQATVPWYPHIL